MRSDEGELSGPKAFAIDYTIAAVSAAISRTATTPIERVHLLFKFQNELIKDGRIERPYRGYIDCIWRTVADEGITSLWRENVLHVFRCIQVFALDFAIKDQIKKKMFGHSKDNNGWKWFAGNLTCGGLAGACSLFCLYPLDHNRIRFDIWRATGKKHYGILNLYKRALKKHGLRIIYRGFGTTCASFIIHRSIYFGMYDSLKPVVLQGSLQDSFVASFCLGWGVTTVAGVAAYPVDPVKLRVMKFGAVQHKSLFHAFVKIIKKEGVKPLFRGAANVPRRALAGAGVLVLYDKLHEKFLLF